MLFGREWMVHTYTQELSVWSRWLSPVSVDTDSFDLDDWDTIEATMEDGTVITITDVED